MFLIGVVHIFVLPMLKNGNKCVHTHTHRFSCRAVTIFRCNLNLIIQGDIFTDCVTCNIFNKLLIYFILVYSSLLFHTRVSF